MPTKTDDDTPVQKNMTATERKELRSIIKGEFELLRKELYDRLIELQDEAEKEIDAAFTAEVKEAEKAQAKLKAEAEKFRTKALAMEAEFRERGLRPVGRGLASYELPYSAWEPVRMADAKREARNKVERDYRNALSTLARKEHELNKNLSLSALFTSEAFAFLENVPTAEELLYLNVGTVAEITGGDK